MKPRFPLPNRCGDTSLRAKLINTLKHHPFPVVAQLDQVVAVSFAFPEPALRHLIPAGLEMDTYEGLGFITAALVWTSALRPAGFPEILGQDFFLAGYRIFTRLRNPSGRRLRGLKIIRSETDKHRMVWLGNLMTGYSYRHVNVKIETQGSSTHVLTSLADGTPTLDLTFSAGSEETRLPAGSPFPDWRTARRFAGPMPFTFSPEADGSFVVIEGSRQAWVPQPVHVKDWQVSLFKEGSLQGVEPILANAFIVKNVPYRWEKGQIIRPGIAP